MKKTVIALALGLSVSTSVLAELTNLHFYAQKEHFKEGIIEFEISSNKEQLKELAISQSGIKNAPIHIAVLEKNIDALKIFANHKEFIDVRNSNEQTALMLALKKGMRDYAKILINAGASIDAVDAQGNVVDAYAKVGGINLKKLYDARKRDIVNENVESENTSELQEDSVIDSEYYSRLDRLEENFVGVVDIIGKHDSVIKNIKDSKVNVKDELERATNDILNLKNNLNKQAKILIPIVKSNKYTIDAINKQIVIIDKKSAELSDKIESLNELKKEVMDRMEDIKNIEASLDETKKNLLKDELEQILESNNAPKQAEIKESDLLGDDSDLDSQLLEDTNLKIIMVEEEEPTTMEKVLDVIKTNIMLISLIALLSILLIYILIKNKTKKEKAKKVKEKEVIESEDDEEIEDTSKLNKTLDQIEIETDNDIDDLFDLDDLSEDHDK